jgi:hypothetical protein
MPSGGHPGYDSVYVPVKNILDMMGLPMVDWADLCGIWMEIESETWDVYIVAPEHANEELGLGQYWTVSLYYQQGVGVWDFQAEDVTTAILWAVEIVREMTK